MLFIQLINSSANPPGLAVRLGFARSELWRWSGLVGVGIVRRVCGRVNARSDNQRAVKVDGAEFAVLFDVRFAGFGEPVQAQAVFIWLNFRQ